MNGEEAATIWDLLGIEATNDERAIKRAYAKQLKLSPPGDDAGAFQKLREARDEAIWFAKYDLDSYDFDEEEDDFHKEEDVPQNEDVIPEEGDRFEVVSESSDLDQAEPFLETTPNEPVAIVEPDVIEQPFIVEETFIAEEPLFIDARESDEEFDGLADDQIEERVEGQLDTLNEIDRELEMLSGPWDSWQMGRWQGFVNLVRESPLEVFQYAEYELLHNLVQTLEEHLPQSQSEQMACQNVLIFLDREFGWSQNDRRVYNMLPDNQAEQLLSSIRGLDSEYNSYNSNKYYDASGFPLLSSKEFHLYLGKNGSVYEQYYYNCQKGGRQLKGSWFWPGLLFSPLWMARRCNDGLESLLGIVYVIAGSFIVYGLNEDVSEYWLFGGMVIGCIHITTGWFGKQMVINTMASIFTEVAGDDELSEKERYKKIRTVGQNGFRGMVGYIWGMSGIALIVGVIFSIVMGR